MKIILKPDNIGLIYMKDSIYAIYGLNLSPSWHCKKSITQNRKDYLLVMSMRNLKI